ncbi:MAG: hypothetical protein ACFFAY_04145 [Promethearchaeota archaeon]
MSIEGEERKYYYNPDASRKECRNTTIYCVLSITLFILAGAINSPLIRETIPGGPLTLMLLSIGIIIAVLLLCLWQAPRPRRAD